MAERRGCGEVKRFVATIRAVTGSLLSEYRARNLIPELLKIDSRRRSSAVADPISKSSEARAQVITLTPVLAAQESRTAKDSWHTPRGNADRYWRSSPHTAITCPRRGSYGRNP
ncbi:hypothetical protein LQL77_30860 [Rhodococcus cerastii]|nr:hypothetical protein [Rhodococcus cerastii]